jgi:hypothetical protein
MEVERPKRHVARDLVSGELAAAGCSNPECRQQRFAQQLTQQLTRCFQGQGLRLWHPMQGQVLE